ncbi:two-component system sensor histidine kinase QseC, partial [Xanthomonas citri pv. citri]|nr:two-component system sensor histidine kinase QseC [Xanthomonas citri pv. citri]
AFAVFTEQGDPIFNDGRDGQFIEFAPHRGFKNVRLIEHDDEEDEVDTWRIFWLKHRDLYIAVGQEIDYRNKIINKV